MFADRFGLDARALQDWEQGRRVPDRAARVLLIVIDSDPEAVVRALGKLKERTPSASSSGESTIIFVTAREVSTDTPGNAGRGGLDGVPGEMGIPGCCLHLGMAQQLPDHSQTLAESQRTRGKAVVLIGVEY